MRAILTYHSIDRSGSPVSLAPETFARHVRWLASGPVKVVPLAELASAPGDAVAITFDDGYVSVATEAVPRLAEHGLPATVFVVSARVGGTNAWDGEPPARGPAVPVLPLLDWDALGRLAERGVELGAHTRRHPRLDSLPTDALAEEIVGSADDVEAHLGRRPRAFAYPYGTVSGAATACVRASFGWGVTTELRLLGAAEDRALLPRLDAYYFRHPAQLERWGEARFVARIRVRHAARRARRWLGLA